MSRISLEALCWPQISEMVFSPLSFFCYSQAVGLSTSAAMWEDLMLCLPDDLFCFLKKVGTSLYPVYMKATYSFLFFSCSSFGVTYLRLFLSLFMNSMLHMGSQHAHEAMSQGDFGISVSELCSSLKFIVKMGLILWLCYLPSFLC